MPLFSLSALFLCSFSLAQQPLFSPSHPPCPSSPLQKSPSPLVFFSQTPTSSRFGYRLGTGVDLRPTWACGGYDRRGLEMVAMDCRSLDFEVVTSGRAPAPRTGVAHMIVMICGGLQWVCGGFDWVDFAVMVGLWVFLWWFAVDLRWIAVVGLHLQ